MTAQARWLFSEKRGAARMQQVTDTRLLRLKVVLWFRPYNRFMRRWMSR